MKYVLTPLVCFLWSCATFAADSTIVFRKVNYSDLFETAKKENKGVMLYFHFDGCGACVTMEKTAFKDKNVSDYYNKNFINFEINTQKGAGIEINKIYNIKLHPTFIFFDNKGNELHRLVGVFSPEEFFNRANEALRSNKNLTHYKNQYRSGNRDPDFLFDYAYMMRDANELDSLLINEYLSTQDTVNFSKERNIKFLYEFVRHRGQICVPFNSRAYLFMFHNRNLFARYFDPEQVNTRLMFIILTAVYDAIEKKDAIAFSNAIEALKEFDTGKEYNFKETDGRISSWTISKALVLSATITFYEKTGDADKYYLYLNQYIKKIWDDASELNSFAWDIYLNAQEKETEKIQIAVKCSIRSIELNNNYANNDTYAWLLYKSGEHNKALKQAHKAIEIAKKNKEDYSETQKLVDLLAGKK